MAKPGRRDVVPSKGGKGWDVTNPGKKEPVSHHKTQTNAEKAAKKDIRPQGGEVVIHGRDGRIRDKDTDPARQGPLPAERHEALNNLRLKRSRSIQVEG
jgi:hypothetical protein